LSHAPFVHLRVRSCYSLLESTVRQGALLERCQRERMPAVAVADRANLFGALEFSESAAKAGIQPIIGCLLPIAGHEPGRGNGRPATPSLLPVLVQNQGGYRNLLKLLSRAYLEGEVGGAQELQLDDLCEHGAGLIALTGGVDGPIGRALASGNRGLAEGLLARLIEVFRDRLYVELVRHGLEVEDQVEPALIDLALALEVPLVATNDVHFLDAAEWEPHDVLLCIAEGAQVA
jgi:DNA polymerase III subunit alpha